MARIGFIAVLAALLSVSSVESLGSCKKGAIDGCFLNIGTYNTQTYGTMLCSSTDKTTGTSTTGDVYVTPLCYTGVFTYSTSYGAYNYVVRGGIESAYGVVSCSTICESMRTNFESVAASTQVSGTTSLNYFRCSHSSNGNNDDISSVTSSTVITCSQTTSGASNLFGTYQMMFMAVVALFGALYARLH